MENFKLLKIIDKFEGKRNCALTFIIPPNYNFKTDLKRILNVIKSIKRESRKKQLMRVINIVLNETSDIKMFENSGSIICAGLNKLGKIDYYLIKANIKINKFEYSFDYVFNHNRIKRFMFENIKYIKDSDINDLIDNINELVISDRIVYQKKIIDYLNTDFLETIVFIPKDNEPLPDNLLIASINNHINIEILNTNISLHKLIVQDNTFFGILKYNFTNETTYI